MNYIRHKSYTLKEATQRMERYCAYQERCHAEVRLKLQQMRMIPEAIDQIMVHLIKHDFLNEERFARAYVRGKFSQKSWGKNRIMRALKQKEISAFNIKKGLEEISSKDYDRRFHELAEKKWTELKAESLPAKKQKLANYLLYRGWESERVYDKIYELSAP